MKRTKIKIKPWPKEPWTSKEVKGELRIFDANGNDITANKQAIKRAVRCANACARIYAPEATDEYVANLEDLNKQAFDLARSLIGKVDKIRGDIKLNISGLKETVARLES